MNINDMFEEDQIVELRSAGWKIDNIIDPSEQAQIAAVSDRGEYIESIVDKGIVPSNAVLLTALITYPDALCFADEPYHPKALFLGLINPALLRKNEAFGKDTFERYLSWLTKNPTRLRKWLDYYKVWHDFYSDPANSKRFDQDHEDWREMVYHLIEEL